MNEEEYRELREACDRVLLAPNSTIEWVAIPWLHVIREHPAFLANYVDLFEPVRSINAIGRQWLRSLRNRAGWFRQLGRALRSDRQPWFGPKEFPERIDVLFVSHLLNASHAGQADDFYFGELPNELVARGYSVVIALINHSDQSGEALADKWIGSSVPRVILSGSLGISEEVALHRRLKMESLRLRKVAKNETVGLFRKVLMRASQEALSGGSRTTLRMASQIGALVANLKPKAIVVTHEGHAWERVAFAAARSAVPEVRCIGYQHAALFRLQHAIRRSLAREYNPDQILAAGTVSKAQMEGAPGLEGIPISVLGSNRSFKGATINGGCMTDQKQAGYSNNPACLVLPEGIASECHLLFGFSLTCAQVFPEIQFIWRLHPIVTFGSLTAQNPMLRNLPENVVLSRETFGEDIARCRWALYRGTTAVVQAVMAGLRPIYLQLPGEMTVDPLYELDGWRVRIETVSEFKRLMNIESNRSSSFLKSEMQIAKRYCENFFLPFNHNVFTSSSL
ncbi:MAG: hypothetical protein ACOY4M_09385 [Pseudomonadota bacterium]